MNADELGSVAAQSGVASAQFEGDHLISHLLDPEQTTKAAIPNHLLRYYSTDGESYRTKDSQHRTDNPWALEPSKRVQSFTLPLAGILTLAIYTCPGGAVRHRCPPH